MSLNVLGKVLYIKQTVWITGSAAAAAFLLNGTFCVEGVGAGREPDWLKWQEKRAEINIRWSRTSVQVRSLSGTYLLVLLSGLGHGRRENLWNSLPLALPAGSRSRRQGGASWPMENYFQAEAFNLDKVLDEFEQNEGEELTRTRRLPVCPESRTLNWVGVHGGQFRVTVCDPQTSSRNWTTERIVLERGFSVKPDTCED